MKGDFTDCKVNSLGLRASLLLSRTLVEGTHDQRMFKGVRVGILCRDYLHACPKEFLLLLGYQMLSGRLHMLPHENMTNLSEDVPGMFAWPAHCTQ